MQAFTVSGFCLSDGPGEPASWQPARKTNVVLIRVSDEQDAVAFPEELQYYRQRNEELQMEVDKLEEVLAQMEEDSMGQQQVAIIPCVIIPCVHNIHSRCRQPANSLALLVFRRVMLSDTPAICPS